MICRFIKCRICKAGPLPKASLCLPAVGQHELLWVNRDTLEEVDRTPTHGQPVFIIAQPASPFVWVNFATPLNDTVQIVDSRNHEVVATLTPGKAILAYGICAARGRGLDFIA